VQLELVIPYDRGELVSGLHDHGRILTTSSEESGTRVTVLVDEEHANVLRPFVAEPATEVHA
jgi:GTP-binding protein HflX